MVIIDEGPRETIQGAEETMKAREGQEEDNLQQLNQEQSTETDEIKLRIK